MENKTKKKSFFNLFNILTVCVVLAVVAVAVYFFFFRDAGGADVSSSGVDFMAECEIEYTVEIKHVRDELIGKIKVGEELVDSVRQKVIGVVESVEYPQSVDYAFDEDTDQIVVRERPDHSDVIVVVRSRAVKLQTGYDIGGCLVSVGRAVYARFPNFSGMGYCISIKVINE